MRCNILACKSGSTAQEFALSTNARAISPWPIPAYRSPNSPFPINQSITLLHRRDKTTQHHLRTCDLFHNLSQTKHKVSLSAIYTRLVGPRKRRISSPHSCAPMISKLEHERIARQVSKTLSMQETEERWGPH